MRRKTATQLSYCKQLATSVYLATFLGFLSSLTPGQIAAQILPAQVASDLANSAPDPANSASEPANSIVEAETEIVMSSTNLDEAWVEFTPLTLDVDSFVQHLPLLESGAEPLRIRPEIPVGPAMLCLGAKDLSITCTPYFHYRGPAEDFQGTLEISPELISGFAVGGHIRLRAFPVERAEVAVIPADLQALRPFSLPLPSTERETQDLKRHLITDSDGAFVTPSIAPGAYFLEIKLPSGRIHRGPDFLIAAEPGPTDGKPEGNEPTNSESFVDLGRIDIGDGLAVDLHIVDLAGDPIPDALVEARQGIHPTDLINFEQRSNADGLAQIVGFSAEQPVTFRVDADGFRGARFGYELIPALINASLEPLASLEGEVFLTSGEPAVSAMISLEPTDLSPAATVLPEATEGPEPTSGQGSSQTVQASDEGHFRFDALPAGIYQLTISAADRAVYNAPYQATAGVADRLQPITLLAGREVVGRVIDASTEAGVAGVEIRASSPPGAVSTATDADGVFTFSTISSDLLTLDFFAEGYADKTRTFEPAELVSKQPLEVALDQGGWVLAIVRDQEALDQPCQGCHLLVLPDEQPLITDPKGEALSRPLTPGLHQVQRPKITHLGSTVIEQPNAETRPVRVIAGEVSVVRFGESRESLTLRFEPAPDRHWTLGVRSPGRIDRLLPQNDGSFHISRRPGETPQIFLHLFDHGTGREAEIYQADLPKEIPDGEWVIPLRTTLILGQVTVEGQPRSGLRIRFESLIRSTTAAVVWTQNDGSFVVPHLPPEVYSVVIDDREMTFTSLHAGTQLDLGTFDLTEGSF